MIYTITIVGGGAAGFFAANLLLETLPEAKILIIEKSSKILQKVKISGGGRCNVTHHCFNPTEFSINYPRGAKFLKNSLRTFGAAEMIEWLKEHDVPTKIESDGRMFPSSNSSQTIVDCFSNVLKSTRVKLLTGQNFKKFETEKDNYTIETEKDKFKSKYIIIATGSSPNVWKYLKSKDLKIVSPVPSLFTFVLANHPLKGLEGISLENVSIKVIGKKLVNSGPWLITHQGISGPAVLKLSAFGARELSELNYQFQILINLTGLEKVEAVIEKLKEYLSSAKLIVNTPLFNISKRLWKRLVERAEIDQNKPWNELGKKGLNKLVEEIYQGTYHVIGKNTFKDEFVTAGGVDLSEINKKTAELIKHPRVYLAGECLNIDGVTGGFNFQAAWTTAYLVTQGILGKEDL